MRALKSLRYAIGDIVFVIGRYARRVARVLRDLAVAAGRGVRRFWRSLSVVARRRLVAALGVAVLLLVLFSASCPTCPASSPAATRCPPADDAVELVPADALAYVHANLDPETEQYAAASELAAELPVLGGELDRPRPGAGPRPARHGARLRARPCARGSAARRRSRSWTGSGPPPSGSACSRSPTARAPPSTPRRWRSARSRPPSTEGVELTIGPARRRHGAGRGLPRDRRRRRRARRDRHRHRRRRRRVAGRRSGRDRGPRRAARAQPRRGLRLRRRGRRS